MKLYFIFSLAAICVLVAAAFPQSLNSKFIRSEQAVDGRYIVLLEDTSLPIGATASSIRSRARDVAQGYGAQIDRTFTSAIKGFAARMSESQAIALSNDQRVKLVEADRVISVSNTQSNAPWNLDRVDQRNLPWTSTYDYTGTGAGVHVYIIDTGIRVTHTDFEGRADVAYDNVGDGQNGNDCNGHGTHVAGIVGGANWGVAKQALLHAVRVLPCSGNGLLSNVMAGVDWVTANHQSPAVANISAATPGASSLLEIAITNSIMSGVVYTIAAGNAASDACGYTPARTPGALTVGASDETDLRALYSNYGSCIDLFAPGNRIDSDWASGDTATHNLSGSSMAAPMVAGAAALYLGSNPTASAAATIQTIKSSATPGVLDTLDPASPNLLLYSRVVLSTTSTPVSITGTVRNSVGRGIRGVGVTIVDVASGVTYQARTNQLGIFTFNSMSSGSTYVVTATATSRFQIVNNTRTLTILDNVSGVDFVADTLTH
jgi:subtilisin family serine protease